MISSSFDDARIGTITSEYDHYLEWKDTYPQEIDPNLKSQEKLIIGALKKEHIVDLLRNFTVFQDIPEGRIKIVGTYTNFEQSTKSSTCFLQK